jgi:hypothetical protein
MKDNERRFYETLTDNSKKRIINTKCGRRAGHSK